MLGGANIGLLFPFLDRKKCIQTARNLRKLPQIFARKTPSRYVSEWGFVFFRKFPQIFRRKTVDISVFRYLLPALYWDRMEEID